MKATELDIKLLRIEEDSTHFYRWELMRYEATPVDVSLTSDFSYRAGRRLVSLRLTARYTTFRNQMNRRLLDYVVNSEFELLGPDAEVSVEELVVDTELVRLMLGVALGAMRGMISLRTANTFLSHFPLPIYNINELMEPIMKTAVEITA